MLALAATNVCVQEAKQAISSLSVRSIAPWPDFRFFSFPYLVRIDLKKVTKLSSEDNQKHSHYKTKKMKIYTLRRHYTHAYFT